MVFNYDLVQMKASRQSRPQCQHLWKQAYRPYIDSCGMYLGLKSFPVKGEVGEELLSTACLILLFPKMVSAPPNWRLKIQKIRKK